MALTLKSSGIATEVDQIFAIDGGVIKEYVSNSTIGSGLTQTGTLTYGSRTWNGHAGTEYLITDGSTNRLNVTSAPTHSAVCTVMFVMANTGTFVNAYLSGDGSNGIQIDGNGSGQIVMRDPSSSVSFTTTTVTSSSAYSFALVSRTTNAECYFALEGATASGTDNVVASPSGGGLSNEGGLHTIGGVPGSGSYACQCILAFVLPRAVTLSEFNSIHGDPIGTFFDSGGTGATLGGSASTSAQTAPSTGLSIGL